ncbi:hypothetical protein POKO110462_22395 [Pontibacter korlensis]
MKGYHTVVTTHVFFSGEFTLFIDCSSNSAHHKLVATTEYYRLTIFNKPLYWKNH